MCVCVCVYLCVYFVLIVILRKSETAENKLTLGHRESQMYTQQNKHRLVHKVTYYTYYYIVCHTEGRNICPCIPMYMFHLTYRKSADPMSSFLGSLCYIVCHNPSHSDYFRIGDTLSRYEYHRYKRDKIIHSNKKRRNA